MGSEAIISKIIADAENSAKGYMNEATTRSEEIISSAKAYGEQYLKSAKQELENDVKLLAERKQTVATLDVRKILLQAKQNAITKCFDKAKETVLSFDENEYRRFIKSLIEKFGEDGDKVVLPKSEKRIDKAFVDTVASSCGKKIVLSNETGDFDGGIILAHDGYDKNLTLDTLLRTLREEIEAEVAEILF